MINYLALKQGINKRCIQSIYIFLRRKKYKSYDFSIISSNCSGGVFYHDLRKYVNNHFGDTNENIAN